MSKTGYLASTARNRSAGGCGWTSLTSRRCGCRTRRSTRPSTSRAGARCAVSCTTCLRTGRALRKPRRAAPERRRAGSRTWSSIADRPAEVDDRAVPGHWEGDLIIGTANKSAIGTLVERTTRFVMLLHLPDGPRRPGGPRRDRSPRWPTLPDTLRRTLTWDQGVEMANHVQIAAATDLTSTSATRTPLATRHQREHQRPAAPVLPQGHRPVRAHRRRPRPRRRRAQPPPPQTTRLAHPGRGPRPTTVPSIRSTRCCARPVESARPVR